MLPTGVFAAVFRVPVSSSSVSIAAFSGCFFFSSRRRHTRVKCDWSSDVCSSDLRSGHTGSVWGVPASASSSRPPITTNSLGGRIVMTRLLVKCACLAVLAGLLVLGAGRLSAHEDHDGDADDGASRNMKLVGFNDLQARSTYQPTLHKQGGRYYGRSRGTAPIAACASSG